MFKAIFGGSDTTERRARQPFWMRRVTAVDPGARGADKLVGDWLKDLADCDEATVIVAGLREPQKAYALLRKADGASAAPFGALRGDIAIDGAELLAEAESWGGIVTAAQAIVPRAAAPARPRAFAEPSPPRFAPQDAAVDAAPDDCTEAAPVSPGGALPSYIRDHRKRLRERFLAGGAGPMPDYELLELVLFRAIPRRDVKPLARRLLDHFGDFNRVLSASSARIADVEGAGPAVATELKIVEAAAQRMARARVMHKPVLSGWDALLDYCHTAMAHHETEQFRVLYLDRNNSLIADEEQARGTVDHVPVYPREVVKRALELNASALILVHNHPSGDPAPSRADIAMTAQIQSAAESLSLTLHDHLIIGKETELSFRAAGYL